MSGPSNAPPPVDATGAGGAEGAAGGAARPAKVERPLGADGKPIPGPEQMRQIQAKRKMDQQQKQVDEVIGIMHENVQSVLERDAKLTSLEERADALQDGSAQFEKRAAAMKNKFWLENLKSTIMMVVIALILAGIVYWQFFKPQPQPQMAAGPYYGQQQPVGAGPGQTGQITPAVTTAPAAANPSETVDEDKGN